MASFHLFPQLPLELRYHIWEHSMHGREVVVKKVPYVPGYKVFWNSPTLPPGVLHACHESRSLLGSTYYTKSFTDDTRPNYIWINFAIDSIRTTDGDEGYFRKHGSRVRQLTLEAVYPAWMLSRDDTTDWLRNYPALGKLTVLLMEPFGREYISWLNILEEIDQYLIPWWSLEVEFSDSTGQVMNMENWRRLDREWQLEHFPDEEPVEPSDELWVVPKYGKDRWPIW